MIDANVPPTLGTFALLLKAWRFSYHYIPQQVDWILKFLESSDLDTTPENTVYDHRFFPIVVNVLHMEKLRAATRKSNSFRYFVKESMLTLIYNGHLDDAMDLFANYVPNYFQFSGLDWYDLLNRV